MKKLVVLLALVALPAVSQAQEGAPTRSGMSLSMLSGKLLPEGKNALHVGIGWPGISATFRAGVSSKLDIGGRFSFNYGHENIADVQPGFRLQGLTRLGLADSGRFNFGLMFEPGVGFYFPAGLTEIVLILPVKAVMGIPIGSSLMLNLGMDMPFLVFFYPGFGSTVGLQIMFGGGLEYALDQNLAITFNTRFGPHIPFVTGARAAFAFELQMGVAFKL